MAIDPAMAGSWMGVAFWVVVSVGGSLWAVNQGKQLFASKDPDNDYITREELTRAIETLGMRLAAHETGTRERSERLMTDLHRLEVEITKQSGNVITVVSNALQPVHSSLETLRQKLVVLIARSGGEEQKHG